MTKPNVWNVHKKGNMELLMEVEFQKFLIAISEHTNENTDLLSTFNFYALVELIREKNSKNN